MGKLKKINNEKQLSPTEIKALQARLIEMESTLNSIKCGEVDALIIQNKKGEAQVFTLEGADKPYRILVESMSEGAVTLSTEGDIIHCNKRFSEMVKIPSQDIIGASFFQYIHEAQQEALEVLLTKSKIQSAKGSFTLKAQNNSTKTVLLSCHNFELGNVDGISMVVTDITELNAMHETIALSLKEKVAMLKEIYHRVKNNLQVISSLLNLQAKTIKDPLYRNIFIESSSRVKAMALVHEMLYQSDNLSQVEVGKYLRTLLRNLTEIYHINTTRIKFTTDVDTILLSIENAIPYGLVINELISNAFKHAFPPEKTGEITLSIKSKANDIILILHDNGKGFPLEVDFENTKTLGMQLIHTLTKQLGGSIFLDRTNGTTITLTFSPKSKEELNE